MGVTARLLGAAPLESSVGPYGELVTPLVSADFVQPMPDGRQLAVMSRGHGENATIHDVAGNAIARAALGDAIAHVLTTPSGHVWVGYFDEGVFGGKPPRATASPASPRNWTWTGHCRRAACPTATR